MRPPDSRSAVPDTITVVIPVYRADVALSDLVDQLVSLEPQPSELPFELCEVLLVFDGGSDEVADLVRDLARRHSIVRAIWLTRNFGQHAATFAGMQQATGRWIVTMD